MVSKFITSLLLLQRIMISYEETCNKNVISATWQIKQSWNYYVHSPNYENLTFCPSGSGTCDDARLTLSTADVYVAHCLFKQCTHNSHGGGIFFEASNFMFVESSTFIDCTSSGGGVDGGGIAKYDGQCVVAKCCSIRCLTTECGQFICNWLRDASFTHKDEVHECSVIDSNKTPAEISSVFLWYGAIVVNSVNVSNNKCQEQSAILSMPNANGNLVTGTIKYSHIEGNEATTHTCLHMWYASGTPKHLITCTKLLFPLRLFHF